MIVPNSYSAWHYCITVQCGIVLTPTYVQERLQALSNIQDPNTQSFIRLYGDEYRLQVMQWFQQSISSHQR